MFPLLEHTLETVWPIPGARGIPYLHKQEDDSRPDLSPVTISSVD